MAFPGRRRACFALLALAASALAWGQPQVAFSDFEFVPADPDRDPDGLPGSGDEYMDSGGTWNGAAEVTNSSGDTFRFTLSNTAAGQPDPAVDEIAYDLAVSLTLPAGLRLPVSPFPVTVTASGGDPGLGNCTAPAGVTATQSGSTVSFVLPPGTSLPGQGGGAEPCRLRFEFGLTTRDAVPFAPAGAAVLDYTATFNSVPGDPGSAAAVSGQQTVAVRRGDLIVTKSAVPNPADPNGAYAHGETARWLVSVYNSGSGGTFAVLVQDTPGPHFDAATLSLQPQANAQPGSPLPVPSGSGQYTIAYLAPGARADIVVEAEVAVIAMGGSCPDLRNDVSVADRIGNTSAAFDSVVLDLQDPLLDYTAPNIAIDYGTPTTVSVPIANPGLGGNGGPARNIRMTVTGLAGLTIANVGPQWRWDAPTATFVWLGPDGVEASGDEVLDSGGVVDLSFEVSVPDCAGPTGGAFLTWSPYYENVCGTPFSPPQRQSAYAVNNAPELTVLKQVDSPSSNFGQPGQYELGLTGQNVAALPPADAIDNDNDWVVIDNLPNEVGPGVIPAIPAGTRVYINGVGYDDADSNVPVPGGAYIEWRGDQQDLSDPLPSLVIDFTYACPATPPVLPVQVFNGAILEYPACGFTFGSTAVTTLNESPVDSPAQNFMFAPGTAEGPFEIGRPDTNLVAGDEPNEGERLTFLADYQFPDPYAGVWTGSRFAAELGSGAGGLPGPPLQLAFVDANGNGQPDDGEQSGVSIEVVDPNGPGLPETFLPFGSGPGEVNRLPGGGFDIDLSSLVGVLGNAMAGTRLLVRYRATAPEGNLDANGQPVDDVNLGGWIERVTLTVANNPSACTGDDSYTQGLPFALVRGEINLTGRIEETNDAGVCGQTEAVFDILGPSPRPLVADNVRLLFTSSDYQLPAAATDVTLSGPLAALAPQINPGPGQLEIHVTPNDGDDLVDLSTVRFPISLLPGAPGRELTATVYWDSNHTSPDIGNGWDDDEDRQRSITVVGTTPPAQLDVEFLPPNVILGEPQAFADVDPGLPGNEGVFRWRVRITNTGVAPLENWVFTNRVPPGFLPYRAGSTPAADPGALGDPLMVWSGLPDLPPGGSTEVIVAIGLPQGGGCNVGNPNQTEIRRACTAGSVLFSENGPNVVFPLIDLALEHQAESFCELCRSGWVELEVRNDGASDLYDVVVDEDLTGSGLVYDGQTEIVPEGGAAYVLAADPNADGATALSWDAGSVPELARLYSDLAGNLPTGLRIRFRVRAAGADPEALAGASRQITARADFDLFCGDPGLPPTQETFQVPLRQPQPQVDKRGRNYSARQGEAQAADPVYGGTDDILIWRVRIDEAGAPDSADLEDLLLRDTLTPGTNLQLLYICPDQGAAEAQAAAMESGGGLLAPCVAYSAALDVDDPFGSPANDEPGAFVDLPAGGRTDLYVLGRVGNLCSNEQNDAAIEWGCEASPPAGGLDAATPGVVGADDADGAALSAGVDPNGVIVQQTLTGLDPAQPLGTRGVLTLTVLNNSGGTVRNLRLIDTLPADYELDLTAPIGLDVQPAFGNYPGLVDGYVLDDSNPAQPVFDFTSSTSGTAVQSNLLRHGDRLTLTLQLVRVRPFDALNQPEVREETPADGTDPAYPADATNRVSLRFENTCGTVFDDDDSVNLPSELVAPVDPEDLDVDINPADPDLFYILSDPAATLTFDVVLTNRGGHDAANYDLYVTVGNGIDAGALPAGCNPAAPPPELGEDPINPGGILPPEYDPGDSRSFLCRLDEPLPPGASNTFTFTIQRTLPLGSSGDLTFRADVLGRAVGADGNPVPDRGAAGWPYYSKDNVLVRIIGFNLRKEIVSCSEAGAPPDPIVQIGEECRYRLTAGWFGFATPGFGNIEIRNARVYEGARGNNPPPVEADPAADPPNLPDPLDGQGVLPAGIDFSASSPGVTVAVQNPAAPTDLQETALAWRLDPITAPADDRAEQRFVAEFSTRSLNDPVNASAAPNVHAAERFDEVNVRFDVYFTGSGNRITFDENSPGYPTAADRERRLRIAEPAVGLVKAVCNESLSAAADPLAVGPACQPFVTWPQRAEGDADDRYIFRLTLSNEADAGGLPRAPAFDLRIEDATDPSDQLLPENLATDGIDNDGDGLVDAADPDGEGSVSNTVMADGVPAVLTFEGDHSPALARLDPGASVELYYYARLDSDVTPTQVLDNVAGGPTGDGNAAAGRYDSLAGASGNQSAPAGASGGLTGAREYVLPEARAGIRVLDVTVTPGSKTFTATARRAAGLVTGACTPTPCVDETAVVGEEVEIQLEVGIPVSELRDFRLRDELPAGLRCIEAFPVELPLYDPPAQDPGFDPGGTFPAVQCDADAVEWDLSTAGDQRLLGSGGVGQYTLQARFIARVENLAGIDDGLVLANGGASTAVNVRYVDASGSTVTIDINEARLTLREPQITLQTWFGDPIPFDGDPPPNLVTPDNQIDAGDEITVEVRAENTGTADAYNLVVYDGLPAGLLEYVPGSVVTAPGTPAPTVTVDGAGNPSFTFAPGDAVPVGGAFDFSYRLRVLGTVNPEQSIPHDLYAAWTSLPSAATALNGGGTIGADGAADGLRNGQIPPDGGINDYETGVTAALDVPAPTLAKSDLDPALPAAVGQRKRFALEIGLPEGRALDLRLRDDLAAGGPGLVLEHEAGADILYECAGLVSVAGIPVDCSDSAALTAALAGAVVEPADEATGLIEWNFGTVVTQSENDAGGGAIDPYLRVVYTVRIDNALDVDAGDLLQNAAEVSHAGAAAPVTAPPVVLTVVEPQLQLTKTLTPPAAGPDAGDLVEYTLTVENTGTATAFDVDLVDTLPPALRFDATVSATLDGAPLAGFNPVPAGAPAGPLVWGRGNGDDSLDIPAGGVFVLVYRLRVADDAQPGAVLDNSLSADWSSLDGPSDLERDGAGCPAVTAPDDYCAGPVQAAAAVPELTALDKTREADEYPGTPDDLRVGDTVDFRLEIRLQEGLVRGLVVQDTLPPGLEFVATLSVNGDDSAPYEAVAPFAHAPIAAAATPAAGATGTLTWTLGDVGNAADNDPANDRFVIRYRARVRDDAVAVPYPAAGASSTALANLARVDHLRDDGTPAAGADAAATITVQQPFIGPADLDKQRSDGGPALVSAGQRLEFTLQVCNSGTAPAYGLVLRDTLPPELDGADGAPPDPDVVSVTLGGVDRTPDYDENSPNFAFAGGELIWTLAPGDALDHQAPGNCLVIVYALNVDPEVGPGAIFSNRLQVDRYASRPTDPARLYGPVGPVAVTVTAQTPMNMIKDGPAEATHGQTIEYRLRFPDTPAVTTLYEVEVDDDLPPGLTYLGAAFGPGNGAVGLTDLTAPGSNQVRLRLQQLPAGSQAEILLSVRVEPAAGPAGTVVTNRAEYRFADAPGQPANTFGGSDEASFTVVVPQPLLSKIELGPAAAPGADGFIDLGTPERFALEVANDAPNTTTIWQARLLDILPPEMRGADPPQIVSIEVGGRSLSEAGPDDYDLAYDPASGAFTIELRSAAARIEPGEVLRVVYEAALVEDTGDGLAVVNRALVERWYGEDTSAGVPPGAVVYQQPAGSGTVAVADDDWAHDLPLETRAPVLSFTKRVVNASSGADPGLTARPGDTLRYTLEITNTGRLGTVLQLRDQIDALNTPAAFAPGSLVWVVPPDPAWNDATDPAGGAAGNGLIAIDDIPIDAAGGGADRIELVFELTLAAPLPAGLVVANQAEIDAPAMSPRPSDDPLTPEPADPTVTLIGAEPELVFEKTSADLDGDPGVLLGGERLRYTLTVKNVGDADAVGVVLTDTVPAHTRYVAGSTTLNGAPVPDPADGGAPLEAGLLIQSPGAGAGRLAADPDPAAGNVAVVTFDVRVDEGLANGTVLSNQGVLRGGIEQADPAAPPLPFPPVFSDDPDTPLPADPTQDVVGRGVNLDLLKTVALVDDLDGDGVIDAGDSVRYTLVATNRGNLDAGEVTLLDALPAELAYLPGTTTLDGVVQPDGAGPPLDPAQGGLRFELPAGGGVQVTVDARVAPGTAAGTVVENQARLRSVVQPEEPSDADGNDENGDGPTRFVVGGDGRPTISKEVLVVGGGTAEPGGRLEYRIRVANPGAVPISGLRVLDTLPAGTELVAGSALLDGFARGVSVTGATLSADYGATYGALQPGADFEFSFRVTLDDTLAEGTPIVNTAEVRWNACMSGCPTDSARVDVGGAPGTVTLRGRIWHDPDHDDRHDEGEQVFGGWPLAVYLDRPAPGPADAPIDRFTTSEDGRFAIVGLAPGGPYTVTFAVPEGSPGWPAGSNRALGRSAPAVGEAGLMRIAGIQAEAGRNVLDENLPLDPHGRLYNSVTRERFPAGARLWLRRQDGGPLPEACFDTPPHLGSQQGQISDGEAFYRFDLRPGADPACPVGGVYRLLVETPDGAGGWRENVSVVIPPEPTTLDPENCGADAVPATAECEVQPQPEAPASDVPPGPGTRYHLTVRYGDGERGPFNHHIPLDDVPAGLVTISKTTPLKNVVRGEAVPYTIEVSNPQDFNISGLIVRDTMPPGFKYLPGSARRDGLPFEPLGDGRRLDFPPFALAPGARSRIQLLLVVGAGVGEGEYVNLAQAFIAGLAEPVSGEASATVRVVPDPTFDCADIVGKVFDDRDLDGEPDPGEPGLAGVRLATARGLLVTTDAHGRFHIACAQVPNLDRGSHFIIELDPRTLPSGYRVTSENPRVLRLTRGKFGQVAFGAAVHRVVRLDLADAAFEPGGVALRPHWAGELDTLFERLREAPSVLRVAYLGDLESGALAAARLAAVVAEIEARWRAEGCCYRLLVETETYWRRGRPLQ